VSAVALDKDSSVDEQGETAAGRFDIVNALGLHARAAAKFCKMAGSFDADVVVRREGLEVSAGSILGVLMLEAHAGTQVEIEAKGPEAKQAVDALGALISNRFDEDA